MKHDFSKEWSILVTRFPWLSILASLVLVFTLAFGAKNLTMSSDYRYFFGEGNPQRIAFENLQDVYSKDDSILYIITPKDGVVFKKETLQSLQTLTDKSWKLPFATRVDSITNFQHSVAVEDDLIVADLVGQKELTSTNAEFEKIKNTAINEPLLIHRLINETADVTAVNVRMNFPGKSPMEVPQAAEAARELADDFRKEFPNHEIRISGIVMLNNAFNEAGMKDMMTLTPSMYLVIILIMFFLVRTIAGVAATFFVMLFSIISGMGFAGWVGIPLTPPSSIAPVIIMTLAIADSIHILKSILSEMSNGASKKDAIVEGLRINLRPVFLTSFTTIIGFLALNFSDTPPFHDLGNITAVGVSMAFFLSVVFLPAVLWISPIKQPKPSTVAKPKWATGLSNFISNNISFVFISTAFITIILGLQIPKIELSDQFVEYFDHSIQFRSDAEYGMEKLAGIYQINYDLNTDESQGITDPDYLLKMESFANYLRSIDGVVHVNSLTDTMKRLNKNMHGDNLEYYKIPTSKEMAAQYLLLYEMSLPYGLDLNNQIDIDKASSRIIVTLDNLKTAQILAINEKAENWLKENATELSTLGTSPTVMFSHITERNVIAMAQATLLAFLLITIVMIIALKSFKYGLISLLPNAIPALLAFGIWSLVVGEAGFAIALVGSVTLGIVVDDSVHFLSKYHLAKQEKNLNADEAILYAFTGVGSALITTSVILVVGFLVLTLSSFKMNVILGSLSALTIAIALFVDFTFLPAILRFTDKKSLNTGETMNAKNLASLTLIGLLAFGASEAVNASENKGLWVAQQIDKRDRGFINQTSDSKMILRNKKGKESIREMRVKTLEVNGDGDKSLTIFDSPRDVKGTAFLSYSHATTPDDQWLYMPAIKRVKRISSNNKSGPFMGSEFAYEDISSQEVDKYTYKYVKEENVLGSKGHVIERYPVDKNSGYTKQIVWVDEAEWRVVKIAFYDRKGELLKTLNIEGYQKYSNGKWRPDRLEMFNHQNGKSTSLIWKNIKFNQNINNRDFDKNTLKRIR